MGKRLNTFFKQLSKRKIRFSQKAYIFLFCLLLSTFFWLLSAFSKSYTTTLYAPIEYNTLSEDFILTQAPPSFIPISVQGSGFELLGEKMFLGGKITKVNLDKALPTKNKNRYYIPSAILRNQLEENLDADVDLLDILEDSLFLNTEKRLTKKVKVKPKLNLKFKKGYQQRAAILVNPNFVSISGPEAFIDSIEYLNTVPQELKNLEDSLKRTVKLQLPKNIKGLAVKPEAVEIFIPIEKYTEKVIKLPIQSHSEREEIHQIQTFPDEVELTFLLPLSKYNNINESTLSAAVYYRDEVSARKKLSVSVENIPKYATLTKIVPERVEYILKK